jgi:TP901 family phage tail tape measure protein
VSRNKIGIEVQVQFPTVKELQSELASKWAKVKNGFEGKINISADENYLKRIKKQVQGILDDTVYDIKLNVDMKQALVGIEKFHKELDRLDTELKKSRELKIDVRTLDLDKSFREILQDVRKIDEVIDGQTKGIKAQNHELDEQAGKFAKIQRIQKQLKDGTIATTFKTTVKGDAGREEVTTLKPDGRVDNQLTDNREKALKEIESLMKSIHKIERDQVQAEGQHFDLLEKERQVELNQLKTLEDQYKEKYKINSMDDDIVKELIRQQDATLEIKTTNALIAKEKQEQKEEEQDIASAVSRVAQLENKKWQLNKSIVSAKEDEIDSIKEQYLHYSKIQDSLKNQYSLSQKMTAEQREELDNIKRIGSLETDRLRAKKQQVEEEQRLSKEEKERQKREKQALDEMTRDLREVHAIEMQILSIKERQQASGKVLTQEENDRLQVLDKQLRQAIQIQNETRLYHRTQGAITSEIKEQVKSVKEVQKAEQNRAREVSKMQGEQEKVSAEFKEHEDISRRINQLQRDLIFAGMREQQVIESQISDLREKQQVIRDTLQTENKMTDAMREQIRLTQKLQQEQLQLNRDRQDAREKDMAYNDTGGLVDPWSFAGNVEQGAMTVFEPIRQLDEALISVAKVAEASDEQIRQFAEGAYDAGSALGVTADQYMMAVEKWVTAGKGFKESQELADISLIGSFVGNIQPDDMVKYMSVPYESFKKQGLEANDIINVMNETANNHAIEMEDLGKAYVRSAMTAKDAGVSFEELTAMITGAQEATRKGGERIGTGLKTIAINVSSIFSQLTPANERKFDFFKNIGVNFADANGEMKTMTQVFEDLSGKWDDLSDADKGTAKFYLAGKEHAEVMGALLDQWDSSISKSMQGAMSEIGKGEIGSAYQEHAKQADSVKFKFAELKNSWAELMTTIGGGSGGVAQVMDVLVQGLEQLNSIAKNEKLMELLKYILAGVAFHAGANLARRFFDTIGSGFGGYLKDLREIKGLHNTIWGKGSKVSTPSVNGGRNSSNGSNNTTGGSTTVVGGVGSRTDRRNNRTSSRDTGDAVVRNGGKLKSGTKMIGKLAGLLPVVGDALILLELTGVPVFEKMGGILDSMTTSTKELSTELKKANEKMLLNNSILNGDETKRRKGFEQLETGYDDYTDDRVMDSSEFGKFKEDFNAYTKSLGIDINITMNNKADIEAKIEELRKQLHSLKEVDLLKIEKDFEEKEKTVENAKDEWAKQEGLKESYQEELDGHIERIKVLRNLQKEGAILSQSQITELASADSKTADITEKIEVAEGKIRDSKIVINEVQESVKAQAENLVDYMSKAGSSFQGMNDKTVKKILGEWINQYNTMKVSIGELETAQGQLNSKYGITESLYNEIQKKYPSLNEHSWEEVRAKKEIADKVSKIIEKEKESLEENAKNTKHAIDNGSKQVDKYKEIHDSVDKTTGRIIGAKDETMKWSDEIKLLPAKKTVKLALKIWEETKGIFEKLFGGDRTVSVNAKVKESSVSTAGASNTVGGVTSASVSSTGGNIVKSPATVGSIDHATSTSTTNNARVNSDVWRYWGTDMKIEDIAQAVNDLTRAIHNATDNESELIKLYQKQNKTLRQQESWERRLSSQKQSEMSSVLKKLRGYGFKTSGNDINNLSHSKKFKGDKATEVEGLLNTWKSLGTEMTGISESIVTLNETIKQNNEAIKQAQITKELEAWDSRIKMIDALLTKVGNLDSITSQRLSLLDGNDKELGLFENEKALNNAKGNMSELMKEFNRLSTSTINYEENAKVLEAELQSLGTEILTQADAIMKYQESINDLEFSRVTEDLAEFNSAVSENTGRIDDNISSLKEGLKSGTGLGDLRYASDLDLGRNNEYEKMAQSRIDLEQDVQQALDSFAKKNVERTKRVSNTQLQVESYKYNQMLKMQDDYTKGKKTSYKQAVADFQSLADIGVMDEDYKFVKEIDDFFNYVQEKQDALTKSYQDSMSGASAGEKESLTNQYIIDSLKVQEEYFNATIKASKEAINELKNQLNDPSITDGQRLNLQDAIKDYENSISDAQSSIKDTIRDRFDFEFSLLNEAISEYDKFANELNYAMSILNAIGGDNNSSAGAILGEMLSVEKSRNSEIANTLSSLKEQLSLYEEGSFEWNLINEQVDEYKQLLKDSNLELLEMNKNILSNSFDGTMSQMEKEMFNGKTIAELDRQKDLWLEGLEREIALEDTYQRLADLGTQIHDEKMEQLAKQEKLSKFEMDYLNRQLDVLELQQKLENLNKERSVQTLKQQADGTWDWVYEADANQISDVKDELAQKELELQQAEEDARKEYLSQLEDILTSAEEGDYDNIEEFKGAIEDLGDAFETIVGEFPQIEDEYLKELIDSYSKYIKENGGILDSIQNGNSFTDNKQVFEGFGNEIVKAFDEISKDIGETFANALISKLPNIGIPVEKAVEDRSVSITLEKLEFPNITSSDGIKDAILSLPQIALQKSKQKL